MKIEAYERQNKESIRKNAGRKSFANAEIDRYIELEKMATIQRSEEVKAEIEKRRTKNDDRQASLLQVGSCPGRGKGMVNMRPNG